MQNDLEKESAQSLSSQNQKMLKRYFEQIQKTSSPRIILKLIIISLFLATFLIGGSLAVFLLTFLEKTLISEAQASITTQHQVSVQMPHILILFNDIKCVSEYT